MLCAHHMLWSVPKWQKGRGTPCRWMDVWILANKHVLLLRDAQTQILSCPRERETSEMHRNGTRKRESSSSRQDRLTTLEHSSLFFYSRVILVDCIFWFLV